MERLPRSKVAWLLALLLLSGAANIIGVAYAFVAVVTTPARSTSHLHPAVAFRMQPHVGVATTLVSMAAEKGEETTDEVTEITAAADESDDEDGEDDDEVTEEEEPKEDPELTALKEEIAKLEADLKKARRKVADTSDRVEDFSKPGYARKVAEMENMRRARSVRDSC